MYNLIVSNQFANGTFELAFDRFLEYTSEPLSVQLKSLSVEAVDCIKSWPCILMEEGRGEEVAHIARITDVVNAGSAIRVTFELLDSPSIVNATLWKLRVALDIEQFEFNRNHWAIKDRDLPAILHAADHVLSDVDVGRFRNKPLPAPTRLAIINAGKVIGKWSHTNIDGFLLEAGVGGLVAGRTIGSREDRANAIVQFALAHPASTTAENSLFSAFIARKASTLALDDTASSESAAKRPSEHIEEDLANKSPNRVFVVHGQNESARNAIVSFLATRGLEGIVLHEQPNMGRHLLTKFIDEAELVTFAIVLMTDDDVGGLKGNPLAPRARQNVILELGYFIAHLGQQRVCALISPGLETPSDFDGIVYIRMDVDDRWKAELERELRAARMRLLDPGASP